MAERDNLLVAEQVVAVLNAHDLDRYLKLIDDSYVGENEFRNAARARRGPADWWKCISKRFRISESRANISSRKCA